MANIKSQMKRVKTNEKRRLRNKSVRSSVRTAVRRFREASGRGARSGGTGSVMCFGNVTTPGVSEAWLGRRG